MSVTIKIRRDTAAKWASVNPILSAGEPGFETDTLKVKYGDGVHTWNSLAYASATSVTKDIKALAIAISAALA